MKDRVMMERAGIAAVSYGLVLAAHVELPGLVPFALCLLVAAPAALALATVPGGSRAARASSGAGASRRAVSRSVEHVAPAAGTLGRRASNGRGAAGAVARRDGGTIELGALRTALRRLEGEVYALEDQRRTELVRAGVGVRRRLP